MKRISTGILFIASKSKYSIICIDKLKTVHSKLPFKISVVRLDTKYARDSVKKSITSVPSLVLVQKNRDAMILSGLNEIFPFIQNILKPPLPQPQQSPIQSNFSAQTDPYTPSKSLGKPQVQIRDKKKKKKQVVISDDIVNIDDSTMLEDTSDIQELEVEYVDNGELFQEEEEEEESDPRKKSTRALQGFLINNGTKTQANSMSSLRERAARMQEERVDTLGYKD
jgi:hypothetical protein